MYFSMNYTGQEILDLFEDLREVGLSQTLEEEVNEIYRTLLNVYHNKYSDQMMPSESFLRTLREKEIPHSYVTCLTNAYRYSSYPRGITFGVYPVVKGYVLSQGGIHLKEEWSRRKKSNGHSISEIPDLQTIKTHLRDIKKENPLLEINRFLFLMQG